MLTAQLAQPPATNQTSSGRPSSAPRVWAAPCRVVKLSLQCRWPRLISVVALAGSGKTRVALAVIAYWLGLVGLGKANGNVLAPTFTVVAAIELAERVKDLLGSTKGVVICTWEHLYRILLRSLGLWEGALWSREEEVRWLIGKVGHAILDQFPERVDHAGLSYLLDKAVDLIVRDQPLNSRLDPILTPAWEEMRAEAARQGAILEDGVRKLAKEYVEKLVACLRNSPEWKIGLLICDEDQDQSAGDLVLAVALAHKIPIFTLGDANQAIMGFRGGVGVVCPHYEAQGVSIRSCTLPTNHRATRALNYSAEALMRANEVKEPYPKAAPKAAEGTPALLIACSWETEIAEICAWIYLVLFGVADRDRHSAPQLPKLAPELEDTLRLRLDSLAGAITPEELIYLVPTNAIGNWLKGALDSRGVKVPFLAAQKNPYEGALARLAVTWLAVPGVKIELHALVPPLENLLQSYLLFAGGITSVQRKMVNAMLERLRADSRTTPKEVIWPKDYIAQLLAGSIRELCDSSISKGLASLLVGWLQPYDNRIERFSTLMQLLPRCGERQVSRDTTLAHQTPESWPASFRLLVGDDAISLEPAHVLCDKARRWQMARRNQRLAGGSEIRTCHGAKGLTRKVVIVLRSDVLGHQLTDRFPGIAPSEDERNAEAFRLAYVALTRASEIYVELSLGPANFLHRGGLDGWEYLKI
jgi:hypothetical protein